MTQVGKGTVRGSWGEEKVSCVPSSLGKCCHSLGVHFPSGVTGVTALCHRALTDAGLCPRLLPFFGSCEYFFNCFSLSCCSAVVLLQGDFVARDKHVALLVTFSVDTNGGDATIVWCVAGGWQTSCSAQNSSLQQRAERPECRPCRGGEAPLQRVPSYCHCCGPYCCGSSNNSSLHSWGFQSIMGRETGSSSLAGPAPKGE